MTQQPLFSPLQLGDLTLPNRIVMAPLTRNRAGEGFVPRDLNAEYYAQRASAGLIISEASQISHQGLGYPDTPGIYSPEQIGGWKSVTDAVHAAGGRIFLQLWHVGRISHPSLQPGNDLPVAPSAIKPREGEAATYSGPQPYVTPRALEKEEIPGIIDDYRRAAQNAKEAGFDGVEIHSANGYLLDQFLRDGTNRRTDSYGGSIENRARLTLEVTAAVLEIWSAQRVGIRLSPSSTFNDMHDSDPLATFAYTAKQLNRFGLAYLHVIEPNSRDLLHGGVAVPTRLLRSVFHGNVMVNGDYDAQRGNQAIEAGHAELVSYGRAYIANPDLPARLKTGAVWNEPDSSTFYGGDERGYTDYPTLDQVSLA